MRHVLIRRLMLTLHIRERRIFQLNSFLNTFGKLTSVFIKYYLVLIL